VKSVRICAGDSTLVYDPALMRISVFTSDGRYARALDIRRFTKAGPPPYDFWCNRAGTLAFVHRSTEPPPATGPRRPNVAITVADANATSVSLGTFPASERYFLGSEDIPRPLGKQTTVAITTSTVFVGTGDGFDIASFSLDGTRGPGIRAAVPPVALTAMHVDQFVSRLVARQARRGDPGAVERLYRELQYPKEFPPYASILADVNDNLWVEAYPIPGEGRRKWFVFSNAGRALASLQVPGNFELLGAGGDHAFGIWRDEDDVEFVRLYTLIK
jgi:hypothetical protein